MQQMDKVKLKAQLAALQAQATTCQALIASSKALASMPIMTPMGPVPVPALLQICGSLDQLNQLDTQILRFLATIIDAA